MIIEKTLSLETNIINSTAFSITEDSAKIFSMLSSSLYSDKERSVMIELCSNAIDAHKMVGKAEVPIEITLPTSLSSELKIRDFGPGLSDDHVYQFLTKYGSSNKGSSNDFIGGFGIGSKSPASLTDSWNINSHHNGEYTSYLVHINEDGIPSLSKLYSKPTEESGLEVVIPTTNTDIWHRVARTAFEHYDIQPVIKGTNIEINKIELIPVIENLAYRSKTYIGQGVFAILNNRRYKIDMNLLGIESPFDSTIFLPFKTGELSVSLSREDLHYDKKSRETIIQRINDIKFDLAKLWKENVSTQKTLYSYQIAVIEFDKSGINHKCYKDFSVNDKFANDINFDKLSYFNFRIPLGHEVKFWNNGKKLPNRWNSSVSIQDIDDKCCEITMFINSFKNFHFIFEDCEFITSRIRNSNIKFDKLVILPPELYSMIPDEFNKVMSSTLDRPARASKSKTIKSQIESNIYIKQGKRLIRILESELSRNTLPIICGKFKKANSTSSIIESNLIGFITSKFRYSTNIIFVKDGSDIPTYAISPITFLENEYAKLILNEKELKMEYIVRSFGVNVKFIKLMTSRQELFSALNEHSIIKSFIDEYNALPYTSFTNKLGDLIMVKELIEILKLQKLNWLNDDFEYVTKPIYEKYPMLEIMADWAMGSSNIDIVIDYINQCDFARQTIVKE